MRIGLIMNFSFLIPFIIIEIIHMKSILEPIPFTEDAHTDMIPIITS